MATERISISSVCRQLGYSKQAYYKSLHRRHKRDCHKMAARNHVLSIRRQMPRIGTRKLHYLLKDVFAREQIALGRDGLFDLLRAEGLLINRKRKYVKTTNSKHWMHKYSNLLTDLQVTAPEQVWVADITYIGVGKGYAYLHLITDAYSKKIMGYRLSDNLSAAASVEALKMALKNRKHSYPLIHHSDRGLQYCSLLYTKLLQQHAIGISMTQDGSPYDNAIAERVNGILKDEFAIDEVFDNMQQASDVIKNSIGIYNQQRPHFSNHLLTPNQMHQQNILKPKAWRKKTTRTFEGSCGFLPSLSKL